MKKFMNEDFLLNNKTAKKLYHNYAKQMPIIDYHCHIDPKEIAQNRKFENIAQVWLGGDHYKWRLIRSNGTAEKDITGDGDDRTKFQKFAEAIEKAIGNPMYHWTHLELKRYFGYNGELNGKTAQKVWDICNEKLKQDSMSVRKIIENSNVKVIGTTDDPVDSLQWHNIIKDDQTCKVKVVPSFRPDKVVNINLDIFPEYIKQLETVCEMKINNIDDLYSAMISRIEFFDDMGCKASDHGLDYVVFEYADQKEVDSIFKEGLKSKKLSQDQIEKYKTALLLFFAREYKKRGWVMQIHYNVQRNTNARKFKELGPDTGFDCIRSVDCGQAITQLLSTLDETNDLPKTILYSLNPSDNALIGSIIGAFQGTEVAGKIQHGSAWWFNDTKTGMEKQLTDLASLSVLGNFVGMLTDSRSFLSYTRHEYFRRILCNLVGEWVENGEYPCNIDYLGNMIKNISYYNAKNYFGF